jgi:hypothetical protein
MKTLPITCLALLLAGCAAYDGHSLRAGVSTEAEVRQVMGEPAARFVDADGSRELLYPRGPLGTQTFKARVDGNGILEGVRPVLSDDTFNGIRPGMTQDGILRLIGPPGDTMSYARSGNTSWDYRFVDTWGYRSTFSVTFDGNGVVVSKITRRMQGPLAF